MLGRARRLLDWLLPPQCLACGAPTDRPGALGAECWSEADFIVEPMCRCCGLPFELAMPGGAVCGACLREAPEFERARAVMAYDDLSRRMILGLKYADRTDMAPAFAEWLGCRRRADAGPGGAARQRRNRLKAVFLRRRFRPICAGGDGRYPHLNRRVLSHAQG
ncbi:MAG: double zinc ribbon domain-containing protein [Rhodospirillaceae bacterium]